MRAQKFEFVIGAKSVRRMRELVGASGQCLARAIVRSLAVQFNGRLARASEPLFADVRSFAAIVRKSAGLGAFGECVAIRETRILLLFAFSCTKCPGCCAIRPDFSAALPRGQAHWLVRRRSCEAVTVAAQWQWCSDWQPQSPRQRTRGSQKSVHPASQSVAIDHHRR